jgi:uncharacterized protein YegL
VDEGLLVPSVVNGDIMLLANREISGNVSIFDDTHISANDSLFPFLSATLDSHSATPAINKRAEPCLYGDDELYRQSLPTCSVLL